MNEWAAKRFWTKAQAAETEDGVRIELDGRPVKTPSKQTLVVPSYALADAIAREWDAQDDKIVPDSMPLTRLANSALDKVSVQHAAVADLLAEYGGSDLVCYRAERPNALIARQAELWDPLLVWALETYSIRLAVENGVMPVLQPQDSLDRMTRLTHALDPFALTAFHEVVSLSGSWIIGMAALTESFGIEQLWDAAILDEVFQAQEWGQDEEALEMRAAKHAAFQAADRFWRLCKQDKTETTA